jgi:NAD+ kinase
MKKIKTIALHINPLKTSVSKALQKTIKIIKQHKIQLIAASPSPLFPPEVKVVPEETLLHKADLLIAFGGDGTIINAVRSLKGTSIPVLGVNLGGLGFLTAVSEKSLEEAIPSIINNQFLISCRTMLDIKVISSSKVVSTFTALNDAVVEHGATPRIINLALQVEKYNVTSYACDGLIISTPTGSTGHSLSAGGPILHPATSAFIVSLICPHTLSVRPLVLPDNKKITVSIIKSAADPILSVDGQIALSLHPKDRVEIKKSSATAHLIQTVDYNYFEILQEKLHWRGSAIPT